MTRIIVSGKERLSALRASELAGELSKVLKSPTFKDERVKSIGFQGKELVIEVCTPC